MSSLTNDLASSSGADGRASELDIRHHVFEGQLNKFTNVVKGWQYRWFVVRPETGQLDYHLMEDTHLGSTVLLGKEPQLRVGKCRGSQHLAGCVVVPSDEDSLTFNAIFASGETYKLRAANVKERQVWVDRLRAVADLHDKAIAHTHPPVDHKDARHPTPPPGSKSQLTTKGEPSVALQHLSLSVLDAFGSVHDILHQTDLKHRALCREIEALPMTPKDDGPSCLDHDLIMVKATSQSALICMENALAILQDLVEHRHEKKHKGKGKVQLATPTPRSASPKALVVHNDNNVESQVKDSPSTLASGPNSLSSEAALSRSTLSVDAAQTKAAKIERDWVSMEDSSEEHFHDTSCSQGQSS